MRYFLVFFLLVSNLVTIAQDEGEVHHEVPGSPAFSILDFEPTSVLRPSSVAELKSNIFTSFDQNGNIKPNLGIEVAPYWLASRDGLTLNEYNNPNVWQAFKQSFQLSAAVIEDTSLNRKKFGAGFRFQLLSGKPTQASIDKLEELKAVLTIQTEINAVRGLILSKTINTREAVIAQILKLFKSKNRSNDFIQNFVVFAQDVMVMYQDNKDSLLEFLEHLQKNYSSSEQAEDFMKMSREKVGGFIEIGFASSFSDNGQMSQNPNFEKLGIWVNGSHKYENGNQFVASIRHLFATKDSITTNTDLGISYIKETGRSSITFEAVGRKYKMEYDDTNMAGDPVKVVIKDFTYRLAGTLTYNVNKNVNVNVSLGKGFTDSVISSSSFFTILGLNFNLFKPTNLLLENEG